MVEAERADMTKLEAEEEIAAKDKLLKAKDDGKAAGKDLMEVEEEQQAEMSEDGAMVETNRKVMCGDEEIMTGRETRN